MASRRGYLSQAELEEFADITVTDSDEADDQISQAEEMIDTFVGFQEKYFENDLIGKASAGGETTQFTLDSIHKNNYPYVDYFKGLMVEIIGGTNAGQRKLITGSTTEGVITHEAFTTSNDDTTVYRIYQVGKFPRHCDVFANANESPQKVYKSIPEEVKRATAAQVQYIIEMGSKFFATDASQITDERIGDYSYSKQNSKDSSAPLIAPKAKMLLKGIINRTGRFI